GDGRVRVIHGNYDLYERMRLVGGPGEAGARPPASAAGKAGAGKAGAGKALPAERNGKTRRKRRFPYRKIEEIEADIARRETDLRDLETLLASPDLYRDGDKVKETTRAFEEARAA